MEVFNTEAPANLRPKSAKAVAVINDLLEEDNAFEIAEEELTPTQHLLIVARHFGNRGGPVSLPRPPDPDHPRRPIQLPCAGCQDDSSREKETWTRLLKPYRSICISTTWWPRLKPQPAELGAECPENSQGRLDTRLGPSPTSASQQHSIPANSASNFNGNASGMARVVGNVPADHRPASKHGSRGKDDPLRSLLEDERKRS
uniref:Uncharacterized protein n=1 Tax=Ditylenchus dipsaci TaxID=166011 RepID=A0A915CUS3_9BILA